MVDGIVSAGRSEAVRLTIGKLKIPRWLGRVSYCLVRLAAY